jgi:voltage-gated potassium channel
MNTNALTARRAALIIGVFTVMLTLLAALLVWLLDSEGFTSFGDASWWALQTVTTVGYGDVVPSDTEGRIIGAVVMIGGIGFLAVVTASITAVFVEDARERVAEKHGSRTVSQQLAEIDARLERLERALGSNPGDESGS